MTDETWEAVRKLQDEIRAVQLGNSLDRARNYVDHVERLLDFLRDLDHENTRVQDHNRWNDLRLARLEKLEKLLIEAGFTFPKGVIGYG